MQPVLDYESSPERTSAVKTAFLVYPHLLFQEGFKASRDCSVFLLEDPLFFTQFPFHKQKILFHRASMAAYARELAEAGREVHPPLPPPASEPGELFGRLKRQGFRAVKLFDPVDDWLSRRLSRAAESSGISVDFLENPGFVSTREDIAFFFQNKKQYLLHSFYIWQRKRTGILIKNGGPEGGAWSLDAENRKKLPPGILIPASPLPPPEPESLLSAAVEKDFSAYYGSTEGFSWPVTRSAAEKQLEAFLQQRLASFGDYQDAVSEKEVFVFHSALTAVMNAGLLTAREVLDRTLAFARRHPVPINALEGFIRQILGWREFIRAVYVFKGREERTRNFWRHSRPLPESFWTGTTGIVPFDNAVHKTLRHAYCHHIERLMILGNLMLLCEIHPDEVYRWFMTLFIDAYDWVMVPNVYGMSQFADGGLMATKPYISSSNYVLKMSDYRKGPWCDVWDGLYWRFIDKHRDFFSRNPRLSMMTRQLEKMAPEKLQAHRSAAEGFLKNGCRLEGLSRSK